MSQNCWEICTRGCKNQQTKPDQLPSTNDAWRVRLRAGNEPGDVEASHGSDFPKAARNIGQRLLHSLFEPDFDPVLLGLYLYSARVRSQEELVEEYESHDYLIICAIGSPFLCWMQLCLYFRAKYSMRRSNLVSLMQTPDTDDTLLVSHHNSKVGLLVGCLWTAACGRKLTFRKCRKHVDADHCTDWRASPS